MSRRVITATTINQLLAEGSSCLQLEPGDIITALAAEEAQSKGLHVFPATSECAIAEEAPSCTGDSEYAEVRKAVIAALGHTPEGLDQVIARVLK